MTWPTSNYSNSSGPYLTTGYANQSQPPMAENVAEAVPIPPKFETNYGVTATMSFWWTQQGLLQPIAPQFVNPNYSIFTVSAINTFVILATGNPLPALTASELPSWLTFTDNGNGTATLSGTPSTTGKYQFTFTATNSDQFGSSAVQFFSLSTILP